MGAVTETDDILARQSTISSKKAAAGVEFFSGPVIELRSALGSGGHARCLASSWPPPWMPALDARLDALPGRRRLLPAADNRQEGEKEGEEEEAKPGAICSSPRARMDWAVIAHDRRTLANRSPRGPLWTAV
jgi:hypothetical protein